MNTDDLIRELKADEGEVLSVYICPAKYKTCGVGHKLVPTDPEYDWSEGTPITQDRSDELLARDIATALADCQWSLENWDDLPDEVQLICANMMFNLGRTRFQKFVRFRAAVVEGDWAAAADEMQDSLWARQVPNRASRLISRMRDLAV